MKIITSLKKISMFMVGFTLLTPLRVIFSCGIYIADRYHLPNDNVGLLITLLHNPMEIAGLLGNMISNLLILIPNELFITIVSIITNWLMVLMAVITLYGYTNGNDIGNLTYYKWTLIIYQFIFNINYTFSVRKDNENISFLTAGVPISDVFISFYHWLFIYYANKYNGNDIKYWIVYGQLTIMAILSYVTAVLWSFCYVMPYFMYNNEDQFQAENHGHALTGFVHLADSSSSSLSAAPGDRGCASGGGKQTQNGGPSEKGKNNNGKHEGENGENNETITPEKHKNENLKCAQHSKYGGTGVENLNTQNGKNTTQKEQIATDNDGLDEQRGLKDLFCGWTWSPGLLLIISWGLVYLVYPNIAPYYLVAPEVAYKIELINLIVHTIPPIIICVLDNYSLGPGRKWDGNKAWWNLTWLGCLYIFICIFIFFRVLHGFDSYLRLIIKDNDLLVGILTSSFITCIDAVAAIAASAVGAQVKGYNGSVTTFIVLISLVFLNISAFMGDGYLRTYKKYNKEHWPTKGYSNFDAFKFWIYKSYILAKNSARTAFTANIRYQLARVSDFNKG